MINKTEDLIRKIKKYKGIKVFCGASSRTKFLIEKYNLFNEINYIFDNNIKEKFFLSIPIIDFKELKKIENPLIIICGNHSFDIYRQLKILKKNILIEARQLSKFFPKDFFFEVETPDFQAQNGKDSSHSFLPLLLKELLKFNQKIVTIPTQHNDENYFRKREIKNNSLLFSYHSFGEKNLKKIHFKEGYFFDLITYDDMGYSGWSSLCDERYNKNEMEKIKKISLSKANKDFLYYKKKYIDKNLSKYTQPEITNIVFPKNFVFIPLQTFDDSVMQKSYFEPMVWLENVVKILSDKNINIVIKRHPRCKQKELETKLENLKNQKNITIYNGSIHKAIKECDAVYIINSGVGFESLFHLKPVVTFGAVDYQSATFNVKDFKELEKNLIPKLSEEKIIYIKQFLSYFMREKNININSQKNIEKFVDGFVLKYLNNLLKE